MSFDFEPRHTPADWGVDVGYLVEGEAILDKDDVAEHGGDVLRIGATMTLNFTMTSVQVDLMALLLGMSVLEISLLWDTHIERGTN